VKVDASFGHASGGLLHGESAVDVELERIAEFMKVGVKYVQSFAVALHGFFGEFVSEN
jgi:hypothetical protein